MSRIITYSRNGVTPVAGQDLLTLIPGANRQIRVIECMYIGQHTTVAPASAELSRSTGGTTGGGALTPMQAIPLSGDTISTVANTTWATQPTLAAEGRIQVGGNSMGNCKWSAWQPAMAIEARGTAQQVSLRPTVINGPVNFHVVVEET